MKKMGKNARKKQRQLSNGLNFRPSAITGPKLSEASLIFGPAPKIQPRAVTGLSSRIESRLLYHRGTWTNQGISSVLKKILTSFFNQPLVQLMQLDKTVIRKIFPETQLNLLIKNSRPKWV